MANIDFPAEIRALRATYASIENVSNVEALKEDIAELSERAGEPESVGRPRGRPGDHLEALAPAVRS